MADQQQQSGAAGALGAYNTATAYFNDRRTEEWKRAAFNRTRVLTVQQLFAGYESLGRRQTQDYEATVNQIRQVTAESRLSAAAAVVAGAAHGQRGTSLAELNDQFEQIAMNRVEVLRNNFWDIGMARYAEEANALEAQAYGHLLSNEPAPHQPPNYVNIFLQSAMEGQKFAQTAAKGTGGP